MSVASCLVVSAVGVVKSDRPAHVCAGGGVESRLHGRRALSAHQD